MRNLLWCMCLAVFAFNAVAQPRDCKMIADPAERLKCFDQPKDCKTISDPAERLKCFDTQPSGAPAAAPAAAQETPLLRILKVEPPMGNCRPAPKFWSTTELARLAKLNKSSAVMSLLVKRGFVPACRIHNPISITRFRSPIARSALGPIAMSVFGSRLNRRNTGVESLRRRFKLQTSWACKFMPLTAAE